MVQFPGSRAGKSGLILDSEAVNDVLVVHGFSIGCKADLQAQDISHGLSGFLLRRSRDMGIGVKGEGGGEVAQHTADSLDVHSVLEGDGGEGGAEVVEADLRDAVLSRRRLSILFTLSGEMGPPLGEGNTYGSLVFFFCSRRTSIAWGEILTAR